MSLERIIAHLIGPAEGGQPGSRTLSAAESRAISQRLRTIINDEGGVEDAASGPAAEALRLATYLDGSMTGLERDAFEAELVRSPARRDDVIAAAAWIDEIAAKHEMPPTDLAARAIALETPGAAAPARRAAGFTRIIEWLLPRPRLAIAACALAIFAIVAVGVDIALHTNPQFRQVVQSTLPGGSLPPSDGWRNSSAREPVSSPERPVLQQKAGDAIVLTAETINALIAYRDDPSPARLQDVLTALASAGGAPVPTDRVRAVTVEPKLYERLTQSRAGLPTRIAARLSLDGELVVTIVN